MAAAEVTDFAHTPKAVVIVRRLGIALGSVCIAALSVSVVGGVLLAFADPGHPPLGPGARPIEATIATLITLVLGGFIYADIVRRERGRRTMWLAILWFDAFTLLGALALTPLAITLGAIGCPSGGPECGVERALRVTYGTTALLAIGATGMIGGLGLAARRWRAVRFLLGAVGLAVLGVVLLVVGLAFIEGDGWMTAVITSVWLAVPGISILREAFAAPSIGRSTAVE